MIVNFCITLQNVVIWNNIRNYNIIKNYPIFLRKNYVPCYSW